MLLNIAINKNDDFFARCVEGIKKSLYDEAEYNTEENRKKLPDWTFETKPDEEEQLKEISKSLENITNDICKNSGGKYLIFDDENYCLPFPFIEKYHMFFLQRKWNKPIRDPKRPINAAELFRLTKTDSGNEEREFQNYSKNAGDYNHFLNVIAAAARLVQFLDSKENVLEIICPNDRDQVKYKEYAERIKFEKEDQKHRIFCLMLAAFFHDIGKTVVYHRHGMEGSIIISEHTSQSWYQLNRIAKAHKIESPFQRNDLLFISEMIDFHDQFGTLSTGEAGYLQLINVVEKIKRYSLKHADRQEQRLWSERYLFDLWLLNIADIIVSIDNKWNWQSAWENYDTSEKRIRTFFNHSGTKSIYLVHDLHVANKLLDGINKYRHTDLYSELTKNAHEYSDRHVVERIRRLIYSCIKTSVKKIAYRSEGDRLSNLKNIIPYLNSRHSLSESEIKLTIVRSINATRNFRDFCERFTWIGQMDYSLGFFESICLRALTRINNELDIVNEPQIESTVEDKMKYCFRTKWIRDKYSKDFGDDSEDREHLNLLQSKLFVENYTAIVINLLDHLLFREDGINRIKNIEFNETRDRLTNEKIDSIIYLDGPYHAKRALQLILKTVFIY